MGFVNTPELMALLENTPALADLDLDDYDAIMVAGGLSPMWTYRDSEPLMDALRRFYESERPTAIYCHGTAALADLKLSDGSYLVSGRTVTGFPNREEDYSDQFVGQQVMPWRIEDVLRERGANYIQGGLFKAFAVRDGQLMTGQQQYSGRKVAQMVIEALGARERTDDPRDRWAQQDRRRLDRRAARPRPQRAGARAWRERRRAPGWRGGRAGRSRRSRLARRRNERCRPDVPALRPARGRGRAQQERDRRGRACRARAAGPQLDSWSRRPIARDVHPRPRDLRRVPAGLERPARDRAPNMFMQNVHENTIPSIGDDGAFYANAGQARMSMVDTRDVGRVAALLLIDPGHENEEVDVTGPEALSYADVATKLSAGLRRTVTYAEAPDEAVRQALSGFGLGDWMASSLVELFADYRRSGLDGYAALVTDSIQRLTGLPPRTLDQLLAEGLG
jgi:putative intracellular protease/amidase